MWIKQAHLLAKPVRHPWIAPSRGPPPPQPSFMFILNPPDLLCLVQGHTQTSKDMWEKKHHGAPLVNCIRSFRGFKFRQRLRRRLSKVPSFHRSKLVKIDLSTVWNCNSRTVTPKTREEFTLSSHPTPPHPRHAVASTMCGHASNITLAQPQACVQKTAFYSYRFQAVVKYMTVNQYNGSN